MKKIILSFFIVLTFLIKAEFAQEKLAQAGMQFLSIISDSRAAALAGAVNSRELQSGALFFNPATMGFDTTFFDVTFSLNKWIADIDNHNVSFSISPADGDYGVFGMSLQLVDYGEILGTVVANNDQGYMDIGNISPSAYAIGFGYAKALNEQFSVGGQIKLIQQDLGESIIPASSNSDSSMNAENKLSVLGFDFGTLFKTGYKSLAFGMSIRNFSKEIKYVQEGFQLPLTFSMGISMDLLDFTEYGRDHGLMLSMDAIQARSQVGQVGFGLEYNFMNLLYLRGGYLTNNEENVYNLGLGIAWYGVRFDYAYSPFGIFGDIQRLTLRFSY